MVPSTKAVEAEQVPVDSPDITAAIIRLPDENASLRSEGTVPMLTRQ
jgi:hypothetical protein